MIDVLRSGAYLSRYRSNDCRILPEDIDETLDELVHLVKAFGNAVGAEPISRTVERHDRHQIPRRILTGREREINSSSSSLSMSAKPLSRI